MEQATTLVANTGIQYITIDDVTIDFSTQVCKGLRFYEIQIDDQIFLDPVYYFPLKDKYVRREDLIHGGYMDRQTNQIEQEERIDFSLIRCLPLDETISINNLNVSLSKCLHNSPIECLESQWLPIPFYENDIEGRSESPLNWCRIKFIPKKSSDDLERNYKIIIAFDTQIRNNKFKETPVFNNEPFKSYSLCGMPIDVLEQYNHTKQNHINTIVTPLKIYEYCDLQKRDWINSYVKDLIHGADFDLNNLPEKKRLKYLTYYIYFIYYIQQMKVLPSVTLYSDSGVECINTNLVLDIGNSRTYGIIAEEPLDESFSKTQPLHMCDLETGELYNEPFDMHLAFHHELFGDVNPLESFQFKWPSILRLGKEAQRLIYKEEESQSNNENVTTYYSSPKRYLWDGQQFKGQWEFISKKHFRMGPSSTVFMDGISQQFHSNGSFAENPEALGAKSSFSRRSLMTFCFMEILLQANMQINSSSFRQDKGQEYKKRKISRIIITCPTAMSRKEQKTLRKCAEDATIVLKRYNDQTFNILYNAENDSDKVEIIPSVADLSMTYDNVDNRRSWGYDEATCCQMVYLYSELRRYLGNCDDFFKLYGKVRINRELGDYDKPSLTIGSVDIGAGTSDMMICTYKYDGEGEAVITPIPLFWESFSIAGDDIVKAIITQAILEDNQQKYAGHFGIIANKLKDMNCPNISDKMHTFFGDPSKMTSGDRRIRKNFNTQISLPIATRLLAMLQTESEDTILTFDDFFRENKPSVELLDHFAKHFNFRFEDLYIKFSKEYLNEIIQKVFEPYLRKWTSILYAYGCDIVLLGGRPTSLKEIHDIFLKLYPVAPNRLISMNTYRVGNWYPGSTGVGYFGDRKSLVAVGALIAYLGEAGKLKSFRLNTSQLKRKIQPTSENIGFLNPKTEEMSPAFITQKRNNNTILLQSLPVYIGCKQLEITGYPARVLYKLDFNEDNIRNAALDMIPIDNQDNPNHVATAIETIKFRIKDNMPLKVQIVRDYYSDKEVLSIDTIEDKDRNELSPSYFKISSQSIIEDGSHWLDTGKFVLRTGL